MLISNTPFDPAAAEKILRELGIAYEIRPEDRRIVVPGAIDLSFKELRALPDLRGVIVHGSFTCTHNLLKYLHGMPQEIGGDVYCGNNQLTSLNGAPKNVFGNFHCGSNLLTDLEGGPEYVEGSFFCNDNRLWTVDGSPVSVGCCFFARNNPLISLMGCPAIFKEMNTDIVDYANFDDIPKEHLHHALVSELRRKKIVSSLTFAVSREDAEKINSDLHPQIAKKIRSLKI